MRYNNNYSKKAKWNRKSKRHETLSSRDSDNSKKRSIFKSIGIIVAFVVVLYGTKLLLTPVVRTLAAVWEESTMAISFMLPGGPELAADDYGHTNILLVGIDRRSYQPYQYTGPDGSIARNGFLADTIIVASVDPDTDVVKMVSLPRDLWVQVPAFGELAQQHTKINAVHAFGDRFGYQDSGGMGLLKGVVEDILGVPIHYWARVDFEAFVQGVDAVDGVDLYVEQAFTDYMYPRAGYENASYDERYEIVSFDQGWQHMEGETALKYARSRHAAGPEGSDFARAKRQQNVISSVVNKVTSSETLFSLDRMRGLYGAVSDNVSTNVQLGEIPMFYQVGKKFADLQIEGHVIGGPEIDPPLIYHPDPGLFGGAYVLIPTAGQDNYEQIHNWVSDVLYSPSEESTQNESQ